MSIQSMIDAALSGETVNVPAGIYHEQLVIDKPLSLLGPEPAAGVAIVDAAGLTSEATLLITSSQVTVKQLTFQNGAGPGIRVGTAAIPNLSDVRVEGCTIRGHDLAGVLTVNSCGMNVANNLIENNGLVVSGFIRAGVYLYPHGPTKIQNNVIRGNKGDGIFARASESGLLIEGNTIEGNDFSGITLAWGEQGVAVKDNIIRDCGRDIDDLNGGIVIVQSMAEEINGNIIEDCRQRGIMWVWVPAEGPEPESVSISANQIRRSSYDGIYLFSQGPGSFMPPDPYALKPLMTENLIENNVGAGILISNAYLGNPTGTAQPHLDCNRLENNAWGIFNQTAHVINAINNWWGDASGPFNQTANPGGAGNPVTDNVDFIPWCITPPLPQTTEIDCILVNKVYGRCRKNLVNEIVTDLSKIAEGRVTGVKCQEIRLVDDPRYPVTVEKKADTDLVRVSFYFRYSISFQDITGWKVQNSPPVFYEEVLRAPALVKKSQIKVTADIYLECLECFVSGAKRVTCCLGKSILLQLVSPVPLLLPTFGFSPEPADCLEIGGKCAIFKPNFSRYPPQHQACSAAAVWSISKRAASREGLRVICSKTVICRRQ